ncbi:lysophospholipid acyltransferase family protein [Jannaschia sp. W003]|uniref:lysophospholipid acyltransferase family protein n=1 Tax=Jannaschia sp. W003 TaxID=2867012 RepID=UPI0021A7F9AD|nr:lysophospholipid acyltransferase family protein [Jannaschia sp. W003]UWQ22072.1 lysophospholipid acyltransferase family protein [Jannaschia sp. W003]
MAALADDPVALRSAALCRFFAGVMRREVGRGFRALRLLEPGLPALPEGAPLVVYANHPGWWDPAVFMVMQGALFPDRAPFGPIDAAALERYGFMRRIGMFGIDPDRRSGAVRFLRVGEHVLADPARMLWMTAQGRFADPRERPVALRPGLAHLLARVPGAVALPLALEYPFWSERRPEALAAFGAPVQPRGEGATDALAGELERAQDRLAAAAMARDPGRFRTLHGGTRGVGGVYGLWQAARARLGGRAHDPDHLPER